MAELFKFRCYLCNQMLGAPTSRIGTVTKCPKCAAELVIPSPFNAPEVADESPEDAEVTGIRLEDLGLNLTDRPAPPPPSPVETELFAYLEKSEADPSVAAESDPPDAAEGLPDPSILPELPDPTTSPLVARSPRARRPPQAGSGRRDVVLPRTAVVAWSMFALIALGLTFFCGLLIGHFLWK